MILTARAVTSWLTAVSCCLQIGCAANPYDSQFYQPFQSRQYQHRPDGVKIDAVDRAAKDIAAHLAAGGLRNQNTRALAIYPSNRLDYSERWNSIREAFDGALKREIVKSQTVRVVADGDMGRAIAQLKVNHTNEGALDSASRATKVGNLVGATLFLDVRATQIGDTGDHRVILELIELPSGLVRDVVTADVK